jgi:hypothetical protein
MDYGKWELFDKLIDAYAEFYSPSQHLTVDEVVMPFKGRVIFKQYVSKKHKCFGTKIYKVCDMTGYTYSMRIYLGKDSKMQQMIIVTCTTVRSQTGRVETLTIPSPLQIYLMTWT